MKKRIWIEFCLVILLTFSGCTESVEPVVPQDEDIVVTLLFTNDIESAFEPVEAFWRDDIDEIGGIAQLSTLIGDLRTSEPNVFLFDAGDIFTGALSTVTNGKLMFEFMITMGYDAMTLGNHEFDYGEEILRWEKNRVPFPVVAANLFYKGTDIPFAPPHAVLERNSIRIGVVGILGQDAASSAIAPDHIDLLDVIEPAIAVERSVRELRDDVDIIVLLTHQGHTAPMQTDAEVDPRLQRDIEADIALAGAVDGIDVLFGGHADAGTPEPVVNSDTGTLIMQTYGQGTYLGYLQLTLDATTRQIVAYDGKLLPVNADHLQPDRVIDAKMAAYRSEFPELTQVVGRTEEPMVRRYFDESDLGNLIADVMVEATGADIGMVHPGGVRKDLPGGEITREDVLDALPFVNKTVVVRVSGSQLMSVLEQSASLERGLMQVSGLQIEYDTSRPIGSRIVSVTHDGQPIAEDQFYTIAVNAFLAGGGDNYHTFTATARIGEFGTQADLVAEYLRANEVVPKPPSGRQFDLASGGLETSGLSSD